LHAGRSPGKQAPNRQFVRIPFAGVVAQDIALWVDATSVVVASVDAGPK